MAMKYLLVLALAVLAQGTLITINGIQGDYCTRRYLDPTTSLAAAVQYVDDWDSFGAAQRFDCSTAPTAAAQVPVQNQPTSATTILVSTAPVSTTVSYRVVECRLLTDAVTPDPNTCAQLTGNFFIADAGNDCISQGTGTNLQRPDTTSIVIQSLLTGDDEDAPRKLCYNNPAGATFWTGFYVAWFTPCTSNATCAATYGTRTGPASLRTTCCTNAGATSGICINPNVQTCCGARGIESSLDKCCNDANEIVRYQWQQCPCWTGISCPSTETCCTRTKFSEYTALTNQQGTCYDPRSTMRCCNDGGVYNSGTHQCCAINGVQAKDVPCPCATNDDCLGGQPPNQFNSQMFCCLQRYPALPRYTPVCNAYTNYQTFTALIGAENGNLLNTADPRSVRNSDILQRPADQGFAPGRNLPQFQRCLGQCINTSFEICCNGARCFGQYERCCNQTCCNKYLSSCLEHNRGPVRGSQWNKNDFSVTFAECTTTESMNAFRAFWVYVVPTFLLVGTLTGFAIVVLFVINFTTRAYSLTEKALLLFSVIAILLALPTYFSPIYKYGLVAVVTGLLCILSASARVKWLNILALAFTLLFILYLFDPFHGNNYLNVASLRQANGNPWTWASGVIYSIRGIWPGNQQSNSYCTSFYHGYFVVGSRDFARWSNPAVRNFGYCDRGWATALLVFQGLQLLVSLWMFILALLLLLLRFRKSLYEQIELEIVNHDY